MNVRLSTLTLLEVLGVLPYKGLMGTCGQPGYVFQDFCLKQGIEFIIFLSCFLNAKNSSPVLTLNLHSWYPLTTQWTLIIAVSSVSFKESTF